MARTEGVSFGWYLNIGIVTLMTLGLALSLIRARQHPSAHVPG